MMSWLENMLSDLSIADRKCADAFECDDVIARRCGRFDSWAIKRKNDAHTSYFAKYCRSRAHFQREVFGFQTMKSLADRTSKIISADIIATDPMHNLILTNSLGDCSLEHVMRSGFRIDKCLLTGHSRRQTVDRVIRYLETVIGVIKILQSVEIDSSGDLLDHGIGAVVERINRKLKKIHVQPACGGESYALKLPMDIELSRPFRQCSRALVHGDLSAGNILIDGESVGLVDFEDMGVGPTFRDTLWIRYLFECGNRHFYYFDFSTLSDKLKAAESSSEYKTIYLLDFSLLNLLYIQDKHRTASFWRKALAAREADRTYSEISNLYQLACKDGLLRPSRHAIERSSGQSDNLVIPR